jgi:hypothetical protein
MGVETKENNAPNDDRRLATTTNPTREDDTGGSTLFFEIAQTAAGKIIYCQIRRFIAGTLGQMKPPKLEEAA